MNCVHLVGNLTTDIELRDLGDEKRLAKFGLAVDRGGKNSDTDFFHTSGHGDTNLVHTGGYCNAHLFNPCGHSYSHLVHPCGIAHTNDRTRWLTFRASAGWQTDHGGPLLRDHAGDFRHSQ